MTNITHIANPETIGLTEFQQQALVLGLNKLLNGKHFFISDLQTMMEVLKRESLCSGDDWRCLRLLHCMEWGDMPNALREQTRSRVLELMGLTAVPSVEVVADAPASGAPKKKWGLF